MDWKVDFDWAGAIKRNSEALNAIVAALFTMLDAKVLRIPLPLHRAVLRVLRPTESAVRRLIVIAARGLVVKVAPSRPMPKGHKIGKGDGGRLPSFKLFDTRKDFPELRQRQIRYAKYPPRIHFFGPGSKVDDLWPGRPPKVAPPPPDGLASATRLHRRLQAVKLALEDLPRQARRLVRCQERRKAAPDLALDVKFKSPLRPGRPPGYRKKPIHEVDEILADCDWLACEAMKPNTS